MGNSDLLKEDKITPHMRIMNQKKTFPKETKEKKAMQLIVEKDERMKEKQQQESKVEENSHSIVKVDNDGEKSNATCYKPKNILPVVYPDGSNTATISSFFIPSKSCYVSEGDERSSDNRVPKVGSLWERASRLWKKAIPYNPNAEKFQSPKLDDEAKLPQEPFIINDEVKKRVYMFVPSYSLYKSHSSTKSPSTNNKMEEYTVMNMWGSATDDAMKSEAVFWEELHAQSQRKKNKKRNERRRLQKQREREEREKYRMHDFEERVKRVSMKRPEVEESSSQTDTEEDEEKKKLRRVAHLWRREERRMNKGPLEEGEMSVEERKKLLFGRNGIDLSCLFGAGV